MKNTIICCGNIAFDLIASPLKKGDEGLSFEARPGGAVFNTAILLSRLGLPVSILAKNGQDFLGDALLGIMQNEKISTDHLIPEKRIKTGLALANIDKHGDSSYLFYRETGPHAAFKQEDLSPSLFRDTKIFHTGSAFSYADYTFESSLKLMIRAKRKGIFTSYDPNWRPSRIPNKKKARSRVKKLMAHADLLKMSENDVLGITDKKTLGKALDYLPPQTVITMGSKGSFVWDGKRKITQPAFKTSVVDTIGAGDAFTAGLISRYCSSGKKENWKIGKDDLAFASAASALVCTGKGATQGLKNTGEIKNLLKRTLR
ncbi:carbohydrate kinase family protein [Candidatus Omnitrophota bacterium]